MSENATPPVAPAPNTVSLTIDGQAVTVAKGTNVLDAAKQAGIEISAFCYHPGLSLAACCRQCLVTVEKNPKLQPSCQMGCADGMVVHTTDTASSAARKQMLEFTLVNHPIDCPICDKAGECTLQKLYVENNAADSRVDTPKVHKAKALDIGPHIMLDQERCILCTRCIRVCNEVAKSPQLTMSHRGDHEVLGPAPGAQLDNPYSLNTVDVCPVGALTSKDFRFTMRAWELEMTPSVCQGCATGCNIEVHHKNERIWRLVPRHNPEVNNYWMCDEGRFTYHATREQRLAVPTLAGLPASWEKALARASELLTREGAVAVVLSATHCNEDNYALAKFAKARGVTQVFIDERPADPSRADTILRDADQSPNRTGVQAIAQGLGLTLQPVSELAGSNASTLIVLGGLPRASAEQVAWLRDQVVITLSEHDTTIAKQAAVALPIAIWTELSGTTTNRQGRTQRLYAALPPAGQARAGWDACAKLSSALGTNLTWKHAREVHAEMVSACPAFSGFVWPRDVRPVQLRFAGSRG